MGSALKPGAPFVFTYHHNRASAYYPVAMAILDAGFVVTSTLPCPAEMSGSIHISGTGSSIVDTVFICRSCGDVPASELTNDASEIARLVSFDLARLQAGGLTASPGDTRCIALGHLTRIVVWTLRTSWNRAAGTAEKLARVADALENLAHLEDVLAKIKPTDTPLVTGSQASLFEDLRERARTISF